MSDARPVLIVGAGPTGMTAAIELTRLGVPVRLVERKKAPSTTSRALAVQARTLELLEPRGLTARMVAIGQRGNAATLYGDGSVIGKMALRDIKSRYNYILLLSQAETERLMAEHLAQHGVVIERGAELVAIAQPDIGGKTASTAGVIAVIRDASGNLEEIDAAFLISAEGAHSLVRRTLGLSFMGKSHNQHYALADLYLDGDLPDDELSIFVSRGAFMGVFPMGGRHFRLIGADHDPATTSVDPSLPDIQRLYDTASHIPARLRDMVWSSHFRINSRMVDTMRAGAIFLGGDSAHIHSPAGGQGMNTGIQDMINLCWKLAAVWHGRAGDALLDTYQEDRLPIIRSIVTRTETATDALTGGNAFVHMLVTHLGPFLMGLKAVKRGGLATISQIALNYRASPISETAHAGGELRAGDRLPDLDIVAAGKASRLYELLDPSRLTLLTIGDSDGAADAADLAPWRDMIDLLAVAPPADPTAFRAAFGEGPALILVRPDAYLGFVGRNGDLPALATWLGRWFPPAAATD